MTLMLEVGGVGELTGSIPVVPAAIAATTSVSATTTPSAADGTWGGPAMPTTHRRRHILCHEAAGLVMNLGSSSGHRRTRHVKEVLWYFITVRLHTRQQALLASVLKQEWSRICNMRRCYGFRSHASLCCYVALWGLWCVSSCAAAVAAC